jgi:hypothetical protein
MTLMAHAAGNYQSLPGSGALPFCGGVAVADSDYEIVHAVLGRPIP